MASLVGDHLELTSSHLSQAVMNAALHSNPHHWLLSDLFDSLTKWTSPPAYLTQHAYAWFSAICEKNEDFNVCKNPLVPALRLGFRRDAIRLDSMRYPLSHTKYHERMIDVVFSTGDADTIADVLCAWTLGDLPHLFFPRLVLVWTTSSALRIWCSPQGYGEW